MLGSPSPQQRNIILPAILGLALTISLVFAPTLNFDYVNWDDDVHYVKNPLTQSLGFVNILDIFSMTVSKVYIPLTTLSFAVERAVFGLNPLASHAINLFLHVCVTCFVFLLGMTLGFSAVGAFVGALLFGLHPLHVESVVWVTERKDVLYAFFYMLSLLSYCVHLNRLGYGNKTEILTNFRYPLALSFVFGYLSLMAKPMALSLPLVMLLMDWFFGCRITRRSFLDKALLGAMFVPAVWMTYQCHARTPYFQLPESFVLLIWQVGFYLRQFIVPQTLALIYQRPVPLSWGGAECAASMWTVVLFSALVFVFRRNKKFLFSALYFVFSIFFLLRMDLRADANIVADRFMYLPSLGFCLFAGGALALLIEKRPLIQRVTGFAVMALLFAALCVRTVQQTQVWRNGVTLWTNQLRVQPRGATALALNKLGEAWLDQEAFEQAAERFVKFRALGLPHKEADIRLLQSVDRYFRTALLIKPDYSSAAYHLGYLAHSLGNQERALEYFSSAVRFDESNYRALFFLGEISRREGDLAKSLVFYRLARIWGADDQDFRPKIDHALALISQAGR